MAAFASFTNMIYTALLTWYKLSVFDNLGEGGSAFVQYWR